MPTFTAYHNVTSAQHQQHFNTLTAQGYRMITVSVYGDPGSTLYAAVWVKRASPPWTAVHDVDASGYQQAFNKQVGLGYRVVQVSATGTGGANARFAAIFEKSPSTGWLAKHEESASDFQNQCQWAQNNNFILTSVSLYGTASNRLYAAIWEANTALVAWDYRTELSAADYQNWFNVFTQVPYRLAYTDVSPDQAYIGVYRDDQIGSTIARNGLTAAQYQTEFDKWTKQGYFPLLLQGGGSGTGIRFNVLFAKQETPIARQWHITGQKAPKLAAVDTLVQNLMQQNNIRALSVAARLNGVLSFAHGYTWAEPLYPLTQPESLMRLASCSKAFTNAAVFNLYQNHTLKLNTPVFAYLGIQKAVVSGQTVDPRIHSITVQNLLDHKGGWDTALSGFDAVFSIRLIAQKLGLSRAPTKLEVAQFMYGEPLQHDPGSEYHYSNFGYVLLGLVVEKASGQSFIDYLSQHVLAPIGIKDVFVAGNTLAERRATEVINEQPGIGLSPLHPNTEVWVPYPYGGEGYLTKDMDSGGGLTTSVTSLTRFIHSYMVWGFGPRAIPQGYTWARAGSMAGTSSLAYSRGDGVDWAYIINTRRFFNSTALDSFGATLNTLFTPDSLR